VVLWFTYVKAVFNTLLSVIGMKQIGFKVTQKRPQPLMAAFAAAATATANVIKAVSRRISSRTSTARRPPTDSTSDSRDPEKGSLLGGARREMSHEAGPKAGAVPVVMSTPVPEKRSMVSRVLSPKNTGDLGGVLDPLALVCLFAFALLSLGMGIYRWATQQPAACQPSAC
jgi:hypothetical protein